MILQPVVEGHGEKEASQLLVRRVLEERLSVYDVRVAKPQRRRDIVSLLARGAQDLLRFQRVAEVGSDAVLWILDHDDGCVMDSMGRIQLFLEESGLQRPTAFAFIPKEYENLFLEAPDCCENYYRVPAAQFSAGRDRRDAKGHISRQLGAGNIYKPTTDQAPLTARLNLNLLSEQSRSFRHLESAIRWLVQARPASLYPFRDGRIRAPGN